MLYVLPTLWSWAILVTGETEIFDLGAELKSKEAVVGLEPETGKPSQCFVGELRVRCVPH